MARTCTKHLRYRSFCRCRIRYRTSDVRYRTFDIRYYVRYRIRRRIQKWQEPVPNTYDIVVFADVVYDIVRPTYDIVHLAYDIVYNIYDIVCDIARTISYTICIYDIATVTYRGMHHSYIVYDIVYDIVCDIRSSYRIYIRVCYCQALLLNHLLHQAMPGIIYLGTATTSAIFRISSTHRLVPCHTTLGHLIRLSRDSRQEFLS